MAFSLGFARTVFYYDLLPLPRQRAGLGRSARLSGRGL